MDLTQASFCIVAQIAPLPNNQFYSNELGKLDSLGTSKEIQSQQNSG